MPELPLVFLSGLLGSSHCVGMCGGLALTIGTRSDRMLENLTRQSAYSAGRILTYAFCGCIAGAFSGRLARMGSSLEKLQAALAIVAGVILFWQGLKAAGLGMRNRRASVNLSHPCLAGGALKTFLTGQDLASQFLAGLMTGFLPCGLVYAHLALAGASTSTLRGLATMTVFGLGTVPLMVLTGLSGTILPGNLRRRILTCAAWCVIATGLISTVRGVMALTVPSSAESSRCPFCAARTDVNPGKKPRNTTPSRTSPPSGCFVTILPRGSGGTA